MPKNDPGNWYPISLDAKQAVETYPKLRNGMNPTTILAIDPGTKNLAACFINMGSKIKYIQTTKFLIPKFENTFSTISYLRSVIMEWLSVQLDYVEMPFLDLLIKESIAHGYPGGVADAGRVQHMLESLALSLQVPFLDVNPQAMRSYLGSKSKSDTKLSVYKKFHVEFPSEDECDVFAIAMTGLALISGEYKPKTKKK